MKKLTAISPQPQPVKLVIAMSARTLFDMEDSHEVFVNEGLESFRKFQRDHEDEILQPGAAFALTKKLLSLNSAPGLQDRVEVVLLSRNSPDSGVRVMQSIEHYGLDIDRAVFSQGEGRFRYAKAFGAHLFLSTSPSDVEAALDAGIAAATLLPAVSAAAENDFIRIAFDGDAVLFSDEAEKVYKKEGLGAFHSSEVRLAGIPLGAGPFKVLLETLHGLQQSYGIGECPIRIALVTARGLAAHKRVMHTLRSWGISLDEAAFVGGRGKGPFLEAFQADIFFDDQKAHCDSARLYNVTSGHVPSGVANGR